MRRPGTLRLLHVHAHPDDESSKGAATTARYVAEGIEVLVATCTGGERGSILNPALADDAEVLANIGQIRRQEMAKAREILGVEQAWLGFVDSGYPEGDPPPPLPEGSFAALDPAVAAEPLVKLMRQFRPHVVTTYDEHGGYPHPDHVQCHNVAVEAFRAAADPDRWPEHGIAWQAAKLYYHMSFHKSRNEALLGELRRRGIEPTWLPPASDEDPFSDGRVTTSVRCEEYFEVRDAALLAHATQVDPNGPWFSVPREVERAAWPTEDYQLAISKVPTMLPEDDLFAGLRGPLQADYSI